MEGVNFFILGHHFPSTALVILCLFPWLYSLQQFVGHFFKAKSFIQCVGDACKGDVVLFRQKVYKRGQIMGKRTVAGRIVKESYGTSKQQHTFTVRQINHHYYFRKRDISYLFLLRLFLSSRSKSCGANHIKTSLHFTLC